jgi:hypothetical protein
MMHFFCLHKQTAINSIIGESNNNNNENLVFEINNVLMSQGIPTTTSGGHSGDDNISKTRIDQSRKVIVFITKDLIEQINDNLDNNNIYKCMFECLCKNDHQRCFGAFMEIDTISFCGHLNYW